MVGLPALPTKPSLLLRLAIADCRAVEKADGVVLLMGHWYTPVKPISDGEARERRWDDTEFVTPDGRVLVDATDEKWFADMGYPPLPTTEALCAVCMAGAILHQRYGGGLPEQRPGAAMFDRHKPAMVLVDALRNPVQARDSYNCCRDCAEGLPSIVASVQWDAVIDLVSETYDPNLERADWATYEKVAEYLESEGF